MTQRPDHYAIASELVGHPLPTPDAMLRVIIEQQQTLMQQAQLIARYEKRLSDQQQAIKDLEEQVRHLTDKLYGSSSEQSDGDPDSEPACDTDDQVAQLDDGQADPDEGDINPEDLEPDADESGTRPKRRGRGLPRHLPRIKTVIALTDEQRAGAIRTFEVKVKEELDVIPAQFRVIEIYQEKAVYLDAEGEETLVGAERAPHPIGRSAVSVGFLAWLVAMKYVQGLPLYRIEKELERHGLPLSRTTLAHYVIRLMQRFEALMTHFQASLMSGDDLQCDETRLQVLKEPGMTPTGDKWIWVLRGGPPDKPVVFFHYNKSRGGAVVEQLIEGFEGSYFQSDGYGAYDGVCDRKGLVRLGCWDHARRKAHEAVKAHPSPKDGKPSVAMMMRSKINALYRLEREWKELDDDERYEQRQKKALPLLESLHQWLKDKQPKVVPSSLTGKAISYTLNQWPTLVRYCEHGQLHISNVLTENAIRPCAVGRRAWLFADSPEGAEASAVMFTVVETAKANGLEPSDYLNKVISRIATADTDEALEALMPWNMK